MLQSIGRHVGRRWTRPGCVAILSGDIVVGGACIARRFLSSNTFSSFESLQFAALDHKWQEKWRLGHLDDGLRTHLQDDAARVLGKKYILPMFPYPSGDLHLGHLRVYTISDVLARFSRMEGYNVIHPIGWDAFGLPAENAAIERGIDPQTWTLSNIKRMREQLKSMNGNWDWNREFATCDPTFYKHTQHLFLMLHKAGLAYQAESMVNYDPVDKTVLANEQVDANGFSWRSGAKVEKRLLKQWFLKISEFREELLKDLDLLAEEGAWPERVLSMQKNWLGKSAGARLKFEVTGSDDAKSIEVFTTRPDTIFGVQYIALASSHPIVQKLSRTDSKLKAFVDALGDLPPESKIGYLLPNVHAQNPLTGQESSPDAVKAPLPVFVAPYVLGDYGDGAVMGVPGHDIRDRAFWKINCPESPPRIVVAPEDKSSPGKEGECFVAKGLLTAQSGPFEGQSSTEASESIVQILSDKGRGSAAESWRLRDWLVSRQRYWGTPIPVIHCDSCGAVPVPLEQLPVQLPSVKEHWGKGKVGNPLDHEHDWVNTICPSCNGPAKRDTDTMDTFVDSSWYFMRFLDSENKEELISPRKAKELMPVDIYVGGVEHAILHLLYARFISKFLSTQIYKSTNGGEPFKKLISQGMVHGKTYSDSSSGKFLKPNEVDLSDENNPIVVATGSEATVSFEKMSKSKYNGVDPGACMSKHGADVTRAHILFQAPVSEVLEWDETKIVGVSRWLRRVYEHIDANAVGFSDILGPNEQNYLMCEASLKEIFTEKECAGLKSEWIPGPSSVQLMKDWTKDQYTLDKKLWHKVQSTITKVGDSYRHTQSLNTVVSDLMSLTNEILDHCSAVGYPTNGVGKGSQGLSDRVNALATQTLIQMMAPITPAFSEECWEMLHQSWENEAHPLRRLVAERSVDVAGKPLPSIFDMPFPTVDGTLSLLEPKMQTCAVQVNGKLKFTTEIDLPPSDMQGEDLEKWALFHLNSTVKGRERLTKDLDTSNASRVIVAKSGRLINLVYPESKSSGKKKGKEKAAGTAPNGGKQS